MTTKAVKWETVKVSSTQKKVVARLVKRYIAKNVQNSSMMELAPSLRNKPKWKICTTVAALNAESGSKKSKAASI